MRSPGRRAPRGRPGCYSRTRHERLADLADLAEVDGVAGTAATKTPVTAAIAVTAPLCWSYAFFTVLLWKATKAQADITRRIFSGDG